jgi:formylglycine-generating enzyme required for sulfatase activity
MSAKTFTVREVWPQGTVIREDYVIVERLGAGTFSTAYLARHQYLKSLHVLKRLHEQYASDPQYVELLVSESILVRRLIACPHIARLEDLTRLSDGHVVLFVEYADGGDLVQWLGQGPRKPDEVMEAGRQIALGLAAAHGAGLVHGGLGPEAVLLSRDFEARLWFKLIDLGMAQYQPGFFNRDRVGFAAPERWRTSSNDFQNQSDLYSLGAILYYLLCGRKPYPATDIVSWLDAVRKGLPPAPSEVRPDCPPELSALILALLAAAPEHRPASASAIAARLDTLLHPAPAPAQPSGPPPEARPRKRLTLAKTPPAQDANPQPGATRVHPRDGLRYVLIPPGRFRMGSLTGNADERPVHEVRITRAFWMCQTPVTIAAYLRFLRESKRTIPEFAYSGDDLPVTEVSWHDALSYCEWAGVRLPSESEWEYAARAGTTGDAYGDLVEIAWYERSTKLKGPQPVRHKKPNAFQLYDMLGNVWEWTADWYKDHYESVLPEADPIGPSAGDYKVLRGGSWDDPASLIRASQRGRGRPGVRVADLGFRTCADAIS